MTNALRVFLFALLISACGGGKPTKCSECGEGTLCDTNTGKCVARTAPVAQCSPECTGTRPVCDATTNPQNPHCVQCMSSAHCGAGQTCSAQTCIGGMSGGAGGGSGTAGSGATGGGSATAGGSGATAGGSEGTAGGSSGTAGGTTGTAGGTTGGTAGGFTTAGDGGYNGIGSCAPHDGGVSGGACTPGCNDGFVCIGGNCVLNGGAGPVQVTLRWNTIEDIDLHVLEPLPAGGTCEIAYTDPNQPGDPSTCGAVGSLDLDSEAGCNTDNVDIENIIYPGGGTMAPHGTYSVYVDHFANCDPNLTMAPFEVEARFNGMTAGMCGVFLDTDPDWNNGNATTGRLVMTFTVP